MDTHELAKEVHTTATDNGWDSCAWGNLPVKVMMTVTELEEVRDFVRYGSGDPIREELADVAIRLLSLLYGVWGNAWHVRQYHVGGLSQVLRPIEVSLWDILSPLCKAVESWRSDKRLDVCGWLEIALRETFRLAVTLDLDLEAAIVQKNDKNKKRGYLHGKTRSAG